MSYMLTFTKCLLLLLLGLLLICCSDDIPDVPDQLTEEEFWSIKGPDVKILNPVDGSPVGWLVTFGGIYERVPEGQNILVFASSHAIDPDLWYPRAVALMHTGGVWEARGLIGQINTPSGAKFDIGVMLADEEKTQEIREILESREEIEPIDMADEILARITVKRK